MRKLSLFLLILFSVLQVTHAADIDTSWYEPPIETISEESSDVNKDKLKVEISDDLTIESWFWNTSSDSNGIVSVMKTWLNIMSLLISMVAICSMLYIITMMIFQSHDEGKIKEYKKNLIQILAGFIFYVFLAWTIYVWIINTWISLTPDVSDSTNSQDQQLAPKLLRE